MYDLSVMKTVVDAYRFAFRELRALLTYAIPLIVILVVGVVGITFGGSALQSGSVGLNMLVVFVSYIAGAGLCVSFAVAVHRHYLIGNDPKGPRTILSWKKRHWRFVGWGIAVSIGMGLISMLVTLPLFLASGSSWFGDLLFSHGLYGGLTVTTVIGFVGYSFGYLVVGPSFLRFPLYAIDAEQDIGSQVTDLVQSNRLRIAGVLILGHVLPLMAASYILTFFWLGSDLASFSTQSSSKVTSELVFLCLQLAIVVFFITVTAVMLSMIYKQLSENVTLPEKPAAPQPASDPA